MLFPIACKCISQSIAPNRCCCIDSRATSQSVSSTHCDLMRWSWKYPLRGDGRVWRGKSGCDFCGLRWCSCARTCACRELVMLWTLALVDPWGVSTEKLSWGFTQSDSFDISPERRGCGCRAADETPPPSLQAQIWATLCISSSSSQRMMLPLQTPNTFGFSFTKHHRESPYTINTFCSRTLLWCSLIFHKLEDFQSI